jgi:hypothetical protein
VNIKFNFYDIYGFALPGFLLVAVLWLPFGLIQKNWPDPQLSSAVIGVVLVYIAGHLLQTVARQVLPSRLPNGRFPSSVFLDRGDGTFSDSFKKRIAEQIHFAFGLDVFPELPAHKGDEVPKTVDHVRDEALFLCRSALIKSKTVSYAEQFEGLYALMRGFSAAFAFAFVYYLGWAYSSLLRWQGTGYLIVLGIIGALITILTGNRSNTARRVTAAFLLLAAFASGHYLGQLVVGTSEHRNLFLVGTLLSVFAFERCYGSYKGYAQEFVKAIYRDFYLYETPGAASKPNADQADAVVAE